MNAWVDCLPWYDNSINGLYDLIHDNPRLFRAIVDCAIETYYGEYCEYQASVRYEQEIAGISAIQWEITAEMLPASKATLFDRELLKIKSDFMWANLQSDDRVEVVFWQTTFDPFVSFARRSGRALMMKVLDIPSDELKEAGFSSDFMTKIVGVVTEWAEWQLNPDSTPFDEEQQEDQTGELEDEVDGDSFFDEPDINASDEILSFFFGEEEPDDDELSAYPGDDDNP
jgi:hypothetical protein